MNYTVIDSDNYAAHGISMMFFAGGEPHVKVPRFPKGKILLFAKLRNWTQIGFAALVLDALDHQPDVQVTAFIPYFPGARQDRTDGTAAHTLGVIASLLCQTDANIVVFDAHSDEAFDTIMNLQGYGLEDLAIPTGKACGIIAPDKGAVDRAEAFRDRFYPALPIVRCTKHRNSSTGELSHYECPPLPAKGHYIVVDDICDGGRTFNLLAQAFKERAGYSAEDHYSLELIVSHGIFSKGLDSISQLYSRLTTTNSWCELPEDRGHRARLTVMPLQPLFDKIMGETNA